MRWTLAGYMVRGVVGNSEDNAIVTSAKYSAVEKELEWDYALQVVERHEEKIIYCRFNVMFSA